MQSDSPVKQAEPADKSKSKTRKQRVLEAALKYASNGIAVFPVQSNKAPACSHGVKQATTDPDKLRDLWDNAFGPGGGESIGIAGGGALRLVFVDVDPPMGAISLEQLERDLGPLPPTAIVTTPRGGKHHYFTFPDHLDISLTSNSSSELGPNIDVKICNGYVVAPPSPGYLLTTDLPYEILPENWALRIMAKPAPIAAPVIPARVASDSRYGKAALASAVSKIRAAVVGCRNQTANDEALCLGSLIAGGELLEQGVFETLLDAALSTGVHEDAPNGLTVISNTIRRAIEDGKKSPRTAPVKPGRPALRVVGGTGAAGDASGGGSSSGGSGGSSTPPNANQPDPNAPAWHQFVHKVKGVLSKDPTNALIILTRAPEWQGVISYDTFCDTITWTQDPPQVPGGIQSPSKGDTFVEHHATWLQYALRILHGGKFSIETIWGAVTAAARQNTTHAVRRFFTSNQWDGLPRVDAWMTLYLGAEDTQYTSNVGRWWLISACARIAYPGCQADYTLVLEGPQGCGKSAAIRIIGGDYYLGSLPDLRDQKAAVERLSGRWIVEIGELDALKSAAQTRVKDFLTQTIDYYRPAYGRLPVSRPRECVFVATTNESSYLADHTGARRFWPVAITGLNRDALIADRDQLLAEAWTRLQAGEQWWPTDDFMPTVLDTQESRYQGDEWEPKIEEWVSQQIRPFSVAEVLSGALSLRDPKDWDRPNQTRVGYILRRLGYHIQRTVKGGVRVRLYSKLPADDEPATLLLSDS